MGRVVQTGEEALIEKRPAVMLAFFICAGTQVPCIAGMRYSDHYRLRPAATGGLGRRPQEASRLIDEAFYEGLRAR